LKLLSGEFQVKVYIGFVLSLQCVLPRGSQHRIRAGLSDAIFSNQKIQIWVNFGVSLEDVIYFIAVCLFLGHKLEYFYRNLVYFMVIWYIFPVLVCFTKKNLATLNPSVCNLISHDEKVVRLSQLCQIISDQSPAAPRRKIKICWGQFFRTKRPF
jgi:hypothetical protein